MDQTAVIGAPALHLIYMAVCLGLLAMVYTVPWFDLRSLRHMALRKDASTQDNDPPRPQSDPMERPDLGAILNLLVILGTAFAAFVGWQFPEQIEFFYGKGGSIGLWAPNVEMTPLGRAAQVVGAVCLGLVALRLLKLLVWFTAAGALGAGGVAAIDYVFDLDLLRLL